MSVAVDIDNRCAWRIDRAAVRRVVRRSLTAEGIEAGEVGVAFVDPAEMAELNGRHRGKPRPTDVLSFPLDGGEELPPGVPRQLGDVVVCPAVAAEEGTPIDLLLVHAVLHLTGWDHETDAGEMLAREALLAEGAGAVAAEPA